MTVREAAKPADQRVERCFVQPYAQATRAARLAAGERLCEPGFASRAIHDDEQGVLGDGMIHRRSRRGELRRDAPHPCEVLLFLLDPLMSLRDATVQRQDDGHNQQQDGNDAADGDHAPLTLAEVRQREAHDVPPARIWMRPS